MDRVLIKEKARASLKGKYGDAILLSFICFIIVFGIGFIIGFMNLSEELSSLIIDGISLVVTGLIGFGLYSYFLKLSRNELVTYKELFNHTNMFLDYIVISILVGLFTCLWTLLFIIPGIIAALNYSLVYYIKLDNPELGAMDVLRKSKPMMQGHKWDLFVLGLSFFGWIILGIFTFGILYLWLVPYMQVTYANFYNSLKEKDNVV